MVHPQSEVLSSVREAFLAKGVPIRRSDTPVFIKQRPMLEPGELGPLIRPGRGGTYLDVVQWGRNGRPGEPLQLETRPQGRNFARRCLVLTLRSEPCVLGRLWECVAGIWHPEHPYGAEAFTLLCYDGSGQIIVPDETEWRMWLDPQYDVRDMQVPSQSLAA